MTRDEVLARLVAERAVFDATVAKIPRDALAVAPVGSAHSPKDILVHVTAYDELVIERLRAARRGEITAFDRDRVGWEAFNERVWLQASMADAGTALRRAREVFGDLLAEVHCLADGELNGTVGITEHIDSAWLDGRALWELIAIDCFDHYPMHLEALQAAASRERGAGPPPATP